ncbi:hypothetical protein [Chryseobacterium lathyri]|uniref:Glutathionyl-hydroquinone reductase n=1 Tax=Chryseobacterium lathyri TaxID=395933 RepID=A0ABT9SIA6_9FLAO|nr:hypothetical protein [Chryseobacterium lathyri]MDP9959166.1 glutathionyl-hydroquinone reductase [Chryseobacterium lathyri]
MKQLLLLCAVLFLHLYSCQLKMDSTVILYSENSLIYPTISNSCYGTGGAPAGKATETALKVQVQRLEMINKALK